MRYIISYVKDEDLLWKAEDYKRQLVRFTAQEQFETVAAWADPAGTWQTILITCDPDEAMTEWERIKALTGLTQQDVFNGRIRFRTEVYMLEADSEDFDDPNQYDLLDWHAEGYEHEPEVEEEEDEA